MNEEDRPSGPNAAWAPAERLINSVAEIPEGAMMTKLIFVAEFDTGQSKLAAQISCDHVGTRLKPWEIEGLLMRSLIVSANRNP